MLGYLPTACKPLQLPYWLANETRRELYQRGWLPRHRAQCPVISIGNLTVGGTGKTPLVRHLAGCLREHGFQVAILTRGYGSPGKAFRSRILRSPTEASYREVGDEALLLAEVAPVVVDADRARGAQVATSQLGAELLIMDDGYQHLRLLRDLNVCVLDGSDQHMSELLPCGSRREPWRQLRRADVIVISRGSSALLEAQIATHAPGRPVLEMRSKLDSFLVDGRQAQLAGDRVFAFCGLGNPEQFFELLRRNGLHLLGKRRFPDHHPYTDRDMRKIWDEATASGASRMVTTAKDLVRVPRQWQAGIAVAKLRVEGVEDLLGLALSLRVNGRH